MSSGRGCRGRIGSVINRETGMETLGDLENILRRVVREELAALLQLGPVTVRPAVELPAQVPTNPEHPFLLSERELAMAERLLPEEEGAVLRIRVMAARLEQRGNHSSAERMRRKADRMESQLKLLQTRVGNG